MAETSGTHDLTIMLELASGRIKSGIHVESLKGREAISHPYLHRVTFRSREEIKVDDVIAEGVKVTVKSEAGELVVNGVVVEFSADDPLGDQGYLYALEIAPRLKLLDLSRQNQVYGTNSKVTVADIIKGEVDGTLTSGRDPLTIESEINLTAKYREREFIVQYNETDLAFLSRWCEANGIFYYFTQGDGTETVVFGDSNVAFAQAEQAKLPYRNGHGLLVTTQAAVTSFRFSARPVTKSVILREYNPDKPALVLRSNAEVERGKIGAVVEYGQYFLEPDEGDYLATVRAQEIACRRQVFRGSSNAPQLRPGLFFDLDGHPSLDNRYLIISVEHSVSTPAPSGFGTDEASAGQPYVNNFEAIPFATAFRPERKTPRPLAAGLFTAHVDGESDGSRAEIDDHGRYKIRLRYDEGDSSDGKASEYIRKAEPYAGPSDTGMHFPLLKGTEVVLCCVNGDIDRPIIVGAVPNPLTPNVVASRNQTLNRFRSPSGTLFEMNDGPAS